MIPSKSIEDDARRFRWLLNGNGYFLEHEYLCGHDPCSEREMDKARAKIDEEMAKEFLNWGWIETIRRVVVLFAVTEESLVQLCCNLPSLEADEATIAITMVAALCSVAGQPYPTFPIAVSSAIKRAGSASAVLKSCRNLSFKNNLCERRKEVEALFGLNFVWSGSFLSEPVVLDQIEASLEKLGIKKTLS